VGDAEAIHSGLLSRGVVIRNLSRTPALKNCLRVISTPAENKAFLEAIQLALKEIQ
jgi:histidinol-phosphate/aromatic aminotransferase/cobyric acid decarboxylase-like protein